MANSLSQIFVHITFHVKNGADIKNEERQKLHAYIAGVINNMGSTALAVGGTRNHVHILAPLPKTMALPDMVWTINTDSSKWIKQVDRFIYGHFAWQDGYGAFSVSSSVINKTKEYIANQEEHHKKMTWQEEYKLFLDEYGVKYDERYLFSD